MKTWKDLLSKKNAIITLVLLAAITWASTVTPEFTGYDDIKLIVNNERIHKGPLYTAKFYGNIVSDSHNVAWTNYPTVIYRPLEWFGSAVGYALWGPKSVLFHIFFNINFHIINTLLLFFILLKVFAGEDAVIPKPEKSKAKKSKNPTKKSFKDKILESTSHINQTYKDSPKAIALATIITGLWTVHPLHSEALNMLTSGVGFLWATFFMLTAFTINVYAEDMGKLKNLALMLVSFVFFIISYLGSEMAIIGPVVLFALFIYQKLIFNKNINWFKALVALATIPTYLNHRSSIVTEHHAWASNSFAEFIERLTVLAPEIFFHYIKLFFYPEVLSIDQHHQVRLEEAYTPYHIVCFLVSLAFVVGIIYFFYKALNTAKEDFVHKQNYFIIGFSILLTGLSIGIALNIIPLYVLARERYCYIFVLSLIMLIVFLCYEYLYCRSSNNEFTFNQRDKILVAIASVFLVGFSTRSIIRNLDWHDGEKIWYSTINSVDDIGVQQVWRYRLRDFYKDPGTKTFKADPVLYKKTHDDFDNFPKDHDLDNVETFKRIFRETSENHMADKYAYKGRKTIASALFFNAMSESSKKNFARSFQLFRLAHNYYPEHFQVNINLLVHLHNKDASATEFLINIMDQEAQNNPFLAKGFLDTLHLIKHPRYYELAKKYRDINPNTQVFDVFLFNSAYMSGRYDESYEAAKRIVNKYHEEKSFDQFIIGYDKGLYQKRDDYKPTR